jgi:hypothetical protein
MRALSWMAAAGAAASFLFFTDRGRQMKSHAGRSLHDGYDRIRDGMARRRTRGMVRDAVSHDHADTVMAQAFEEAVVQS